MKTQSDQQRDATLRSLGARAGGQFPDRSVRTSESGESDPTVERPLEEARLAREDEEADRD